MQIFDLYRIAATFKPIEGLILYVSTTGDDPYSGLTGEYHQTDESAAGFERVWSNTQNPQYAIRHENNRWSLIHTADNSAVTVCMMGIAVADDPWTDVYLQDVITPTPYVIAYENITSTTLAAPSGDVPEALAVSGSGGNTVNVDGKYDTRSVALVSGPHADDSWAKSTTAKIKFVDWRWKIMSYDEAAVFYQSKLTLQWPDNSSVNWELGPSGVAPVPSVTVFSEPEGVNVQMTGITDSGQPAVGAAANGKYVLMDTAKTGRERVWKHETEEWYVKVAYDFWAIVSEATSNSYNMYVQDYTYSYQAPWNEETGESYTWYYQGNATQAEFMPLPADGNTNIIMKNPSASAYDGIYLKRKATNAGAPVSYLTPGADTEQMWIHTSNDYAVWTAGGNWCIGPVTVAENGSVTVGTPAYTAAVSNSWPWKLTGDFGITNFIMRRTNRTKITIPQGMEITRSGNDSSLIGTYKFRGINGSIFPVVGDYYYQYETGGNKFVVENDSQGNPKWRVYSGSNSVYTGPADLDWPDTTTFSANYGSADVKAIAIPTGLTNIRVDQIEGQSAGSFTAFGVYRRVEQFLWKDTEVRSTQFSYAYPENTKDFTTFGNTVYSDRKLWVRATQYDAFIGTENLSLRDYVATSFFTQWGSNTALKRLVEAIGSGNWKFEIDFTVGAYNANRRAVWVYTWGSSTIELNDQESGMVLHVNGVPQTKLFSLNIIYERSVPVSLVVERKGTTITVSAVQNGEEISSHTHTIAADSVFFLSPELMTNTGILSVVRLTATATGETWEAPYDIIYMPPDTISSVSADAIYMQPDASDPTKNQVLFGTVTKDNSSPLGITWTSSTLSAVVSPVFWPWEVDAALSPGVNVYPTNLTEDPPPPPAYIIVRGGMRSCNGYYGIRTLNNESTPYNGDQWVIGTMSADVRVMKLHYNASKTRWEFFYDGYSRAHMYSSTTTELWPNDPDLVWYWGDAGNQTTGSIVTGMTVTGTDAAQVSDRTVVSHSYYSSSGYSANGEMWPVYNDPITPSAAPSADSEFMLYISEEDYRQCRVYIEQTDGLYYWKAGLTTGNYRESWGQIATTFEGAVTLEELGWPWDRPDWYAYDNGGMSFGSRGVTPPAFAVKGTDITQNFGTFEGYCTGGQAGLKQFNTTYKTQSSSIDAAPKIYSKFILGDYQLSLCYQNGYPSAAGWMLVADGANRDSRMRPYTSANCSLSDLKWPWELAWSTNNNSYQPPISFSKGNGSEGGLYFGDYIQLSIGDSIKRLGYTASGLSGAFDITVGYPVSEESGSEAIVWYPDYAGVWKADQGVLLFLQAMGNDYLMCWTSPNPITDSRINQYTTVYGILLMKEVNGVYTWTLSEIKIGNTSSDTTLYTVMATAQSSTPTPPTGQANWTFSTSPTGVPGEVDITAVTDSSLSFIRRPGFSPSVLDKWTDTTDSTTYIEWDSAGKNWTLRYQGSLLSNSSPFESSPADRFPWELKSGEWSAAESTFTMGIEGSRFVMTGTTFRDGAFNGNYWSHDFGGTVPRTGVPSYKTKYYNTVNMKSCMLNDQRGPQWMFIEDYTGQSWMTRVVSPSYNSWRAPDSALSGLKVPFYSEYFWTSYSGDSNVTGRIQPWTTMVKFDGNAFDYSTRNIFGGKFNVTLTSGASTYELLFIHATGTSLMPYPQDGDVWTAEHVSGGAFRCRWDATNKYWVFEQEVEGVFTSLVTTQSAAASTPSWFPWEYKLYEFSGYAKAGVTPVDPFISAIFTNGCRMVLTGINDTVNGSYISYEIDPDNYQSNQSWYNEKGIALYRDGDTLWRIGSSSNNYTDASAPNSSTYPWKGDGVPNWAYGPECFLLNGRPQENTGFATAYDVITSDADLNGRYWCIGYVYNDTDGYSKLTYSNASGVRLRLDNNTWLLGDDATGARYQAPFDRTAVGMVYPQNSSLTWEAVLGGTGTATNTPIVLAVDLETKVPSANAFAITASGAGSVDADGDYASAGTDKSFGVDRVWNNAQSTFKLKSIWSTSGHYWVFTVSDQETGDVSSYEYYCPITVSEDASGKVTASDPYGEDGVTVTWTVGSGTAPAPTATAVIIKNSLIVSGVTNPSDMNGTYEIVDDSAEGDARAWQFGSYYIRRGGSYMAWMLTTSTSRPSYPDSSVYFYTQSDSYTDPYQSDGSSWSWHSNNGSGTLSVVKE